MGRPVLANTAPLSHGDPKHHLNTESQAPEELSGAAAVRSSHLAKPKTRCKARKCVGDIPGCLKMPRSRRVKDTYTESDVNDSAVTWDASPGMGLCLKAVASSMGLSPAEGLGGAEGGSRQLGRVMPWP